MSKYYVVCNSIAIKQFKSYVVCVLQSQIEQYMWTMPQYDSDSSEDVYFMEAFNIYFNHLNSRTKSVNLNDVFLKLDNKNAQLLSSTSLCVYIYIYYIYIYVYMCMCVCVRVCVCECVCMRAS